MLSTTAFDHIVLSVRDVDVSAAWYGTVLGMERHDDRSPEGTIRTSMSSGRDKIDLRPADASQESWFTADAPAAGSAGLCFLTEAEPDAVVAHLRHCGIAIVVA